MTGGNAVQVEQIQPAAPDKTYQRCIAGEGADPIEDCGGCWDFVDVMKAPRDPHRPRNEQTAHIIADMVGEDWNYSRFPVTDVNERIRKAFQTSESKTEWANGQRSACRCPPLFRTAGSVRTILATVRYRPSRCWNRRGASEWSIAFSTHSRGYLTDCNAIFVWCCSYTFSYTFERNWGLFGLGESGVFDL